MIKNSDAKFTPATDEDDVIILMQNIDSNDSKSQWSQTRSFSCHK